MTLCPKQALSAHKRFLRAQQLPRTRRRKSSATTDTTIINCRKIRVPSALGQEISLTAKHLHLHSVKFERIYKQNTLPPLSTESAS